MVTEAAREKDQDLLEQVEQLARDKGIAGAPGHRAAWPTWAGSKQSWAMCQVAPWVLRHSRNRPMVCSSKATRV
eukprot:Skav233592  [mRNA]  locus=scaffold2520:574611:575325:- [translate_table: standard]